MEVEHKLNFSRIVFPHFQLVSNEAGGFM